MVDLHRPVSPTSAMRVDRAIGDVALPRPPSSRVLRSGCSRGAGPAGSECGTARPAATVRTRFCCHCWPWGWQRGDEVIVPAFAFAAVAETVCCWAAFRSSPTSIPALSIRPGRASPGWCRSVPVSSSRPSVRAAVRYGCAHGRCEGARPEGDRGQRPVAGSRMPHVRRREPLCGYDRGDRVHVVLSLQSAGLLRRRRARCSPTTTGWRPASGRWAVTVGSPNMTAGWSE